ncbi:MAG: hypothetical protein DHS20C08_04640 [Rhodomicrobium sp.]|nr:MAG: hypothetical protein DHS20C08_04640 [Rhodomicrobium sp.]
MNPKFQRYIDAKRDGKSIEDCVRAALPAVDENSTRFKQWVAFAETHYTDIRKTIKLEGLNKSKLKVVSKKTPAKKPTVKATAPEATEEE